MTTVKESPMPSIELYSSVRADKNKENQLYYRFSPSSGNASGRNLQSFSWNRSTDNIVGSFQLVIKESTDNYADDLVWDKIQNLDVIKIKENGSDISFIGVVTRKTFRANAPYTKTITIQGKSIEYLFDMYSICLDLTAMSYINADKETLQLITSLADGNKEKTVKSAVKVIIDSFVNLSNQFAGVSAIKILEILNSVYGDISKTENYLTCSDNLKFKLPISNISYQYSENKIFAMIEKILPKPIYEVFGKIIKGKPSIVVRQVPFSPDDWTENISDYKINPYLISGYSLSQSCEEVYTAFISFVEGSSLSPDTYKITQGSVNGIEGSEENDKKSVYGYKLLSCNFIGYPTGKTDDENSNINESVVEAMKNNNKLLKDWFSNLDEMFTGNISFVYYSDGKTLPAQCGDVINFGEGQFYIKSESHSWTYGNAINITYSVDRGGKYINGKWNSLSGISAPLMEVKNGN